MRSKRRKQYGVGLWMVLQMVMPAASTRHERLMSSSPNVAQHA